MQVTERYEGDVFIVTVKEKRLDARVAVACKNYLTEKFDESVYSIIVNLSEVQFIDSSGLGALVTALKILGNRGTMKLFGVNESVKEIFQLTRMDRIFDLHEFEVSDSLSQEKIADAEKNEGNEYPYSADHRGEQNFLFHN